MLQVYVTCVAYLEISRDMGTTMTTGLYNDSFKTKTNKEISL